MGIDPKEFERVRKLLDTDIRARVMADSCVSLALTELGDQMPDDIRDCREYAYRVAQLATSVLVTRIYSGDAEIAQLVAERDNLRDQALYYLNLSPPQPVIVSDISGLVRP